MNCNTSHCSRGLFGSCFARKNADKLQIYIGGKKKNTHTLRSPEQKQALIFRFKSQNC